MTILTPSPSPTSLGVAAPPTRIRPIPFARVLGVELRKMFDTRAGFWLMVSILVTAALATAGVVAFAPDDALTFDSFAAAVGIPMVVILPIVAILSVTGEWSQRSGLTTFTLVPHRGRVIGAKALVAVAVGVVSVLVALALGALGNLVGSALAGVDTVWNLSATGIAQIMLGNVIGLMTGFMLGVLVRSSAGAVVAYFVLAFVLPPITEVLAMSQSWFADVRGWVDPNFAQGPLFSGVALTGGEWAHLAVTSLAWIVLPLAVGLAQVRRAEVK